MVFKFEIRVDVRKTSEITQRNVFIFSWAKAPALYVTMSQVDEDEEDHFLDLAFTAQIEIRNVKVKVTLR